MVVLLLPLAPSLKRYSYTVSEPLSLVLLEPSNIHNSSAQTLLPIHCHYGPIVIRYRRLRIIYNLGRADSK